MKSRFTFSQIINMNIGFFGIQYSFGLQQGAVTPIYDMLHASPDQIPLLHLAGPVTGLLVQPIIGALSDNTYSAKWGRRKPYFLIGALVCSIALLLYPFCSELWMAAGLLWLLDVGNNTAMEPYRAFVGDVLPREQQAQGFLAQSFFTGLGQTLVNLSIFALPLFITSKIGVLPDIWVYIAFFAGSIFSIASIWWSVHTTPEPAPSAEELAAHQQHTGLAAIIKPFSDIAAAVSHMPAALWKLACVYLFQWYALFIYWQNASKCIAANVFKTTPDNEALYSEAVSWTGAVNAWYNIVTFLVAFGLVRVAQKYGAAKTHAVCLLLAALGLVAFSYLTDKYALFVAITGFGIAWASIMGVPYLLVQDAIPAQKRGVYMGIINMMIVIPMLIQTISFGPIMKFALGNNSSSAVLCAGVLLALASLLTLVLFRKQEHTVSN